MLEEPYNTRLTLSNGTKQKYVFLDDHNQMVGSQDADYTFSNIMRNTHSSLYWWYLCKLFSRAGSLLDDLLLLSGLYMTFKGNLLKKGKSENKRQKVRDCMRLLGQSLRFRW